MILNGLASVKVADAACGLRHTIVISADGRIFTFGCGVDGQLGVIGVEGMAEYDPKEDILKNVRTAVEVMLRGRRSRRLFRSNSV